MNTVDIIRSNIRYFLKKNNLTQAALSEYLGVQNTYISYILNGKKGTEMKIPLAEKIAKFLGVSLQQLISPVGESDVASNGDDYAYVAYYNVQASAGYGEFVEEEEKVFMPVTRDVLSKLGYKAKDLCVLRVSGDSMEPTLYDGDFVFMLNPKECPAPFVPRIYIIRDAINGVKIKRLDTDKNGNLLVKSDNPHYDTLTYTQEDADNGLITVIGPVVGKICSM